MCGEIHSTAGREVTGPRVLGTPCIGRRTAGLRISGSRPHILRGQSDRSRENPRPQLLTHGKRAGASITGSSSGSTGSGRRPTDRSKLAKRARQLQAVEDMAAKLKPEVDARLEGHSMYALRTTHTTWARTLVSPDSVKAQVGHAPKDIQQQHYLDMRLVAARQSAHAVWDVLTGRRELSGEYRRDHVRLVAVSGADAVHADGPKRDLTEGQEASPALPEDDVETEPPAASGVGVAGRRGLEPPTLGSTVRYSIQLS